MDSSKIHTPTLFTLQQISQLGTTLYIFHIIVANKLFGIGKLSRELIVQICSICNQHNSRIAKVHTLHQQTSQKQHRKALATTRSTKICTPFTITYRSFCFLYILIQSSCSIILRIPTYNFLILLRSIGYISKVLNNITQPCLVQHPLGKSI